MTRVARLACAGAGLDREVLAGEEGLNGLLLLFGWASSVPLHADRSIWYRSAMWRERHLVEPPEGLPVEGTRSRVWSVGVKVEPADLVPVDGPGEELD
jgi:hypothetical protein